MSQKLLQNHGLKVTKQRLALLLTLQKQHQPQTVEKLQEHLPAIQLPALYRMLEDFAAVNLADRVDLGHGHVHYEYNDPKRHHHHLVCDDCGKITDVHVPAEHRLLSSLTKKHHFKTRSHAFELFGLCANCQ